MLPMPTMALHLAEPFLLLDLFPPEERQQTVEAILELAGQVQ